MTNELSFGQRIDETNGLVECWFTHGALDWIKSQDWSDKNIIMYGGGLGNKWLAARCKNLVVIERDGRWLTNDGEYSCIYRPCNDSSGMDEFYLEFPNGFKPDIIISDDAYRTEVVFKAIEYFKGKGGGILICDNFDQDFVWDSPVAVEALMKFENNIYPCTTHTDHNGKCWKTAVIFIK